jgi:hypothetical protein
LAARAIQFTAEQQYRYAMWNLLSTSDTKLIEQFGGVDVFPAGYIEALKSRAIECSGWDGTAVSMTPHGMPRSPTSIAVATKKPKVAVAVVKTGEAVAAPQPKAKCAAFTKSGTQCTVTVSMNSLNHKHCAKHLEWDTRNKAAVVAAPKGPTACSAIKKDGTRCTKTVSGLSVTHQYCGNHYKTMDEQLMRVAATQNKTSAIKAQSVQKLQQQVLSEEEADPDEMDQGQEEDQDQEDQGEEDDQEDDEDYVPVPENAVADSQAPAVPPRAAARSGAVGPS